MKKGFGLILSGGGAKGAYEIGVMKAIEDLDLAKYITGISGSSVGALNAALFTIRDIIRIIDIWENVKQSDFTNIELAKTLEDISRSLLVGMPLHLLANSNPFTGGLYTAKTLNTMGVFKPINTFNQLLALIYGGIFSQKGLEGIIDRNNILGDELYKKYEIFSTVYYEKAEYISWKDKSPEDVKHIMLASANIPGLFSSKTKHLGKPYWDGGIGDNTPIKPLYDIGYRKFIVVYLQKAEKVEQIAHDMKKKFPDAVFYNIYPDSNFNGGLIYALTINRERISSLINQGYLDALPPLWKIKIIDCGCDING
ncbi:MAG: hypothetical protein EWM50_07650 [Gottschalkiaceae bacterium]|nr:MAG: hypothetical protein EWM50_07650 [Gottschalkiaceae bacterium]